MQESVIPCKGCLVYARCQNKKSSDIMQCPIVREHYDIKNAPGNNLWIETDQPFEESVGEMREMFPNLVIRKHCSHCPIWLLE